MKLKTLMTSHRLKTTFSYKQVTGMRKIPNCIYSGIARIKKRRLETLVTNILLQENHVLALIKIRAQWWLKIFFIE
jgi:hypothetical protein